MREALAKLKGVLRDRTVGGWATVAILSAFLLASVGIAVEGWKSAAGTTVPISGYLSMALGAVLSLAVGWGLMALIFYSSRGGFDEPPKIIIDGDEKPPPPSAE